jgi:flagellar hook assembly protein FlgD/outer membrane protein OmpA-like peptidoglycan-associated protein
MTFRYTLVALLLAAASMPLSAQYDPPAGGEEAYQFRSPLFLGEGFSVTADESPTGDIMNPAASARKQRTVIDASYIGLTGFGARSEDRALQGTAVNLGALFPTRAGVIASSVHFLGSTLEPMPLGGTVTAHGSFSKELYPGWLIGAGITLDLGAYEGSFAPGIGVDLGLIHEVGSLGPFEDFSWGFSALRLGYPYQPIPGKSGLPSSFTPALGARADLFHGESVTLGLSTSVSAPRLQNARVNIGTNFSIRERVELFAGWQLDARQLLGETEGTRSLLPSFGVSVNLDTNLQSEDTFVAERGWNRSEVRSRVSAAPLYDGIWGFGAGVNIPLGVVDDAPPQIDMQYDETEYISPNNDGTKDALTVPISITDRRYVRGYTFVVEDSNGVVVRTIDNKEDRPENRRGEGFFARLTSVESGIPIPEEIRWDGTTDEGGDVPDGRYSFRLEAWDDNGNRGNSATHEVVVDRTAPDVEIGQIPEDRKIFSPNGDGNKDTVSIPQSGSEEGLWQAQILDSEGNVVRTWQWEDAAPEKVVWDGTNDEGTTVSDGVYRYRIESTDRAGNSNSATMDNLIVRTTATPVRITISDSHLSPNGDGTKDILIFQTEVPVRQGIVEWRLAVRDQAGNTVRTFSGTEVPPEEIVYRGTRDDGSTLSEGQYDARFDVLYQNGNNPSRVSPPFTVDLTPPRASVRASLEVFSPNGDGNKDTIELFQETSTEQEWHGEIRTPEGEVIKSYTWRNNADLTVQWDGRRNDGRLADDGVYIYELYATDRAGNRGSSAPVSFELDTGQTSVLLSAEYEAFSPNSDGTKDTIQFFPQVERNSEVQQYELRIMPVDSEGNTLDSEVVRRMTGRGSIEEPFRWNGFTDAGNRVEDGTYRARVRVTYRNGNVERATTGAFVVDTVAPSATLEAEYSLFSPNGDGNRDSVPINVETSSEVGWQGEIVNDQGATVRRYFWRDTLTDFSWDGRDESGNVVADGTYRLRISATDPAGNRGTASLSGLEVDTRETPVFVTVDRSGFSPNGDGVAEKIMITMYTNIVEGVDTWRLDIVSESGEVVRSYEGEQGKPQRIENWNGRSADGDRVSEGLYTARYHVSYLKGNEPEARSTSFRLDVSAPEVDVSLSPTPFSPDNDGVDDELTIGLDVQDPSGISEWEFTIRDRRGTLFNSFSGEGMPASEIIWNGRSKDGELVISAEDYPYQLEITDTLGNTAVRKGEIPVDILVVREDGQLKVRISNITFPANSPELITDRSTEQGVRNDAIVNRLVEVFTKYSRYDIRIEGHAVRISGTEEEQQEQLIPLSRERAEAVRNALVERGLDRDRFTVVGRGGADPIVPHTNEEERWKNRRVEFILIR